MLTLGAATIERIVDMDPFRFGLTQIFPDAVLSELEDAREWLEPHSLDFATGQVLLGVQSHLLRIGGLTILVDTCVGECKPRPKRPDWHDRRDTGYLDRLAAAGVRPEEVDVVMCTHLHADHAGWNTRLENGRWVPTFPNARYVMGRAELDHWTAEEARAPGEANHGLFADSVKPVVEAGLAEPVEEGFELTAGLTLCALPGHTPGQMGLELAHPGGTAIFCGDALHSPVQLRKPDWSSAFCTDPAQAALTRRAMLERAEGAGGMILPVHLRGAIGFRPERTGDHWRPVYV
ncbi:MBL fold metallo-hydrolase [Albimonas sp. CAU 1670]|uniref:MBL fold metallo-hydrolase n=1 Tax=Albimonas sp. CAU 1670 TaxID=3032599 RepID=UPI0023DCD540|nr:MBL fold metallo-hydrolase [Albimonas sp. CAU 1670]MDF2234726.1 MBL fold metallo-hydrolase [Albimonas sp. CAU 1670]